MASSGKPTALHISLIFSVMLTIILGVVAYLSYRDYSEIRDKHESAAAELQAKENARKKMYDDLQLIKELLGHAYSEVGDRGTSNPNTVVGAMIKDMQEYGDELAEGTYHETIVKLRQELDNVAQQRNELTVQLNDTQNKLVALQNQYQAMVDEHQQAAAQANADLEGLVAEKREIVEAKDRQIAQLQQDLSNALLDLEREQEAHEADNRQREAELAKLAKINDSLRERLDHVTKHSFEVADGEIRWVDHNNGVVWINLGEADKLQVRTSFSVYAKSHQGVGRGPEDIKGTIEITKLLGPHLAEARYFQDDIYRPISEGDPIYTPLWSPNQVLNFSFVGLIDLDNDGRSDRPRLRDIVEATGARIDNEVDDEGNLTGNGIDVDTKFLVIGAIPDPAESPSTEREAIQRIHQQLETLRKEARLQGVRIVSLNQFLDYIGYTSSRRVWVPGTEVPWALKSGARSPAVNEAITGRTSSGQTSGVYNQRGRVRQPTSSGQTSKLYGGNRGGR